MQLAVPTHEALKAFLQPAVADSADSEVIETWDETGPLGTAATSSFVHRTRSGGLMAAT